MSTMLSPRATTSIAWTGGVVAALYAGLVAWSASTLSYDAWVSLLVIPLLVLGSLPMLVRAGRRDPDPRFLKLLVAAFVLKGLATVARYLMAFVLYGGVADAAAYDDNGARLAESYRNGVFDAEIGRDLVGTGFIRVLTGVVYTITGQSVYVAYAVFALLGFWGLYFFYRAFRIALPDADARRYALLMLFLPSMLFWPSGLGKEAWMTFGIGLVAYGSALLLSGDRRCVGPLVLGFLATAMVRPHITAALFVALAAAYLLGRSSRPATELTPIARGVAVVLLAAGGFLVIGQAANFLGVDQVTVSNVDAAIDDTAAKTNTGDSAFTSEKVRSVADFPAAAMSVLFRPFPFEAHNAQTVLASVEGAFLILLTCRSPRRLRSAPRRLRRQPYLLLCIVYSVVFVYGFSNFSNFGILTRERVQVLPFVLVFLALPASAATRPFRSTVTPRRGVSA